MGNSSSARSSMSYSVRACSSLFDSGDDGSMGAQHDDDATAGAAVMEDRGGYLVMRTLGSQLWPLGFSESHRVNSNLPRLSPQPRGNPRR